MGMDENGASGTKENKKSGDGIGVGLDKSMYTVEKGYEKKGKGKDTAEEGGKTGDS